MATTFEHLAGVTTAGEESIDDLAITPETIAIVRGFAREVHIPDPDEHLYAMSDEAFELFLATRGR